MWTNRLTRKRACSAAVSLHLNDTIPISVSYIDNRYTAIEYVWLCCRLAGIGSLLARLLQFTETSSRRDMTKPSPATNSRSETKWPAKAGFFCICGADSRRFAPICTRLSASAPESRRRIASDRENGGAIPAVRHAFRFPAELRAFALWASSRRASHRNYGTKPISR